MRNILIIVKVCVNKKTKGWLIGAWNGKGQAQVGFQCILSQLYPSCKLFCDSVKRDVVYFC